MRHILIIALCAALAGCELIWIPAYVSYVKCGTLKCQDKSDAPDQRDKGE